jgi:hypothetical protein
MDPDQQTFETWLYSSQPVCKTPFVCWRAGLESDERTRDLVGTAQSEDAFNTWHKEMLANRDTLELFDAYRAAVAWGRQYAGLAAPAEALPVVESQSAVR